MEDAFTQTLIKISLPLIITGMVSIFLKYYPKQKLMNRFGPVCKKAGQLISKFGNTKIGKRSMNKLEEGVIATVACVLIHCINEFVNGLRTDNK